MSYRDGSIECTDEEIRIHQYYFPWGTKRIRYSDIKSVRRVDLGVLTGQGRLWGTANFKYWANLDLRRFSKREGLILELGRSIRPFITPSDPDAVVNEILTHANVEVVNSDAPIVETSHS